MKKLAQSAAITAAGRLFPSSNNYDQSVQTWPIAQIKPNPRSARKHSVPQVRQIAWARRPIRSAALEVERRWVGVSVHRWQSIPSSEAIHAGIGLSFEETAADDTRQWHASATT